MAVIATLSKGYDLDYIWKQVDGGPAKDSAGYYIQASENGGEPPGRWWALHGYSDAQLAGLQRMLRFCGLLTLALNTAGAVGHR